MTTDRKCKYYECYNVRIFLEPLHIRCSHTMKLNLLKHNRTDLLL